jgi:hypothetical protein
MDKHTSARRARDAVGEDVLDETDPHAGDDADWERAEPADAVAEPSPLLFWKGLVLGLVFAVVAWGLLAAVLFVVLRLLAGA